MNQTMRYILFIALSMGVILVWGKLQPPPKEVKPPTAVASGATTNPSAGKPAEGIPPGSPAVAPSPALAPGMAGDAELPLGQPVAVHTDRWDAEFSSKGGALAKFELSGAKQSQRQKVNGSFPGVNLSHPGVDQPLPLSVDLATLPGGFGPDAIYQGEKTGPTEVTFRRTRGPITVTKKFSWKPDTYQLHLELTVAGAQAGTVPARVLYTAFEAPGPSSSFLSVGARPEAHQTVCLLVGDRSMKTKPFSDKKPLELLPGTPLFTGIDEKYFLAAMSPSTDPAPSACQIGAQGEAGDHAAVLERSLTVLPNVAATTGVDLFIGPKDVDLLTAADHELYKSVDFGVFAIICRVVLTTMNAIHKFATNWGIAIILLTVLIKLLTFPLTHKQMMSMEEGKRLNPLVEKLKEKYAGDNQRIQVETMKLYKEHGYQPLAGCLPMLIQMPVWYALYSTLSNSFELYHEPFIKGWINDLTFHDPYYILPVAMTVTMFLTQLLTPQAAAPNPQMKTMTYTMPIIFGVFMLGLPAGLVLYIFTNNMLSIIQSLWFRRRAAMTPPSAPAGRA